MNYPGASPRKRVSGKSKSSRLRLAMLVAAISAFAAFMPASASADMTPTASTVYSTNTAGAHGDYTIIQSFSYNGSSEPAAGTEDLKKWIVDSPAGLIGNPNAVPEADRCDPAAFDPSGTMSALNTLGACPATSKVGEALVYLIVDANDPVGCIAPYILGVCLPGGYSLLTMTGDIYLLRTTPEVPTTLGTIFTNSMAYQAAPCGLRTPVSAAPCSLQPKTKSVIQPVTSESGNISDFRLRTVPAENSSRPAAYLPGAHTAFPGGTPLHIRRIDQKLYGYVNNNPANAPFLTYPTNCGPWNSRSYSRAYDTNTGTIAGLDPNNPADTFKESNIDSKTDVDCSTPPSLAPTTAVTFSTGARDSNPQVDVAVSNPGAMPGSDYPKKSVVTFPASLTTDLQGIGNLCEVADRNANTCPAASKVGSAKVETPLLAAGMSGDVYIVRSDDAIPDLAIFFNNPPNSIASFRMDGTTKFVGARGNQIETTLDNGPQNPWTKFTVTINGGTDTLLTISKCPDGSASPEDGPITNVLTGFSGQSATTSTTPVFEDCHGVSKLKKIRKCVQRKLKVSPSYQSRSLLVKSELWIKQSGSKKYKLAKRVKKSPFRFSVKLRRSIRSGKHKYKVRAVYGASPAHPSGHVLQRYSTFRKC